MTSAFTNISSAVIVGQQHCCLPIFSAANTLCYMEKKSKRRELTDEEKQWAEAAKELWEERQLKNPGINQTDPSAVLGIAGQSGFSQFINGKVPMSLEMRAKMAKYFNVPVTRIDQDFYKRLGLSPSHISAAEQAFIDMLGMLDGRDKEEIIGIVELKLRLKNKDPTALLKIIRGVTETEKHMEIQATS